MPTRNVVITDHQASFVAQLVESGEYQNASEVLREGLRLVEQRRVEHAAKLARLRAAIQEGIDDIEAGRYEAFDTPEALGVHLDALAGKAIAQAEAEIEAEAGITASA
ncbi:MAG: type II toxin-antitoxin system ParD family antitoxin [Azoarcus sp.]|jgi:antitoxin ParD1/3/4|nr:type II toxin-antitoxin system ParD family antitoxin [Azoarcus sp.]